MHLYWRIVEELKSMGEMVVILDPSLKRCFREWLTVHEESVRRAHDLAPDPEPFALPVSLN